MESLKARMVEITNRYGHSAPLYELAASIGWNTKWAPQAEQADLARAAYLLGQAASILERIESAEAAEKRGGPTQEQPASASGLRCDLEWYETYHHP